MTRSEDIRRAFAIGAQAGAPMMLWGEPGIGKTATATAVAESLGWQVEVLIGSIREATDFGGMPARTEHGVELLAPAWAVRLQDRHRDQRRSMLFLDELTTAPPSVQAAMLRLLLERVVGEVHLPAEVAVVAAANPPDSAADGYDLAPPLANRLCHLELPVDATAWAQGLTTGWPAPRVPVLPDGWTSALPTWHARAAGFITHRPALLHAFPADLAQQGRAWPSPRSWQTAARLLAAAAVADPGGGSQIELLMGCVGEGAASEFLAWLDAADLPDPEDVLADPSVLDLPMRGDRLLAALGGVVGCVADRPDQDRWDAAWRVLAEAAASGQPDAAAVVARPLLAVRRDSWELPAEIETFSPILAAAGAL